MITAGIDVGLENLKIVILKDGEIIATGSAPSGGGKRGKRVAEVWEKLLKETELSRGDVNKIIATGQGKTDVGFASDKVVEAVADARGARFLYPQATSVIDIGADQTRVVTLGDGPRINEVVLNLKCAAGLGLFLTRMAGRLGMTLDELSKIAIDGDAVLKVNDTCRVFAELDALGLLNRNATREEVARAVIEAVAVRINAILNDKIKPAINSTVLFGGVSRNQALVDALKKRSGINFLIPEKAEYGCALGAAVLAAE